MSDEVLRMQAEVQDRFSGPLKALRAQLLDTTRTGANHSDTLAKGFGKVESAMQSTARTASSVVNPALAAVGVTGLSVGAAVAGVSGALNRLTGNLTGLGQLSRDTGLASKTLQEFGAVAGRVGIEQDAVASASKNFAGQMRTFSRSTGEAFNWVMRQGTDAAGRKAFQDFAVDLQHTSDEGERLKKALSFMETIKDPRERGIFAQQFFGNEDLKRLADGHLGTVVQQFKGARERLGPFNEKDFIDAEKFDRSLSSLKGSMQRLGITIAREVLGPATDLTTWADELVSGKRADITKSIREGLQEVKTELKAIDWHQAGEDAGAFLRSTADLAGGVAKTMHEIAETIHNIREGNVAQALRGADGASGPLARKLAPRVGDDEIEAQENVDRLTKLRDVAREASEHLIGRAQQRVGLMDSPEVAQRKLDAADAELRRLQSRTPEQRKQDFEASEKLRKAVEANTEELKASRAGATVSKMAADGDGPFGGARVQTAALGGGGGFRRPSPLGGGYGSPYGGDGGGSASGPGRFNPLGIRRPAGPIIAPNSEAGQRARSLRGGGNSPVFGGKGAAATGDMMRYAMDQLRKEGVPEDHLRTAAAHLVGQAQMESGLNPNLGHDPDASGRPTGYGIYGARLVRRDRMLSWLENNGFARNSAEGQMRYMSHEAMTDRAYGLTRRILMGQGSGDLERDTNDITGNFESPKRINRRSGAVANALRIGPSSEATAQRAPDASDPLYYPDGRPRLLKPEGMPDAPGVTMREAEAHRRAVQGAMRRPEILADPNDERRQGEKPFYSEEDDRKGARSLGVALRDIRAKQNAQRDQMRLDGARLSATAAQAGVVGPNVNGSVTTVIEKAGPEARAKTTVGGNLFQEVKTQSGGQMRKAD